MLIGQDTQDQDKMIQGSEHLSQIVHLLPTEMRADVEKNIIKNLLEYEEGIMRRTKHVEGIVNDSMAETYLTGMS